MLRIADVVLQSALSRESCWWHTSAREPQTHSLRLIVCLLHLLPSKSHADKQPFLATRFCKLCNRNVAKSHKMGKCIYAIWDQWNYKLHELILLEYICSFIWDLYLNKPKLEPCLHHRWCSAGTAAHVTSKNFCVHHPTFPGLLFFHFTSFLLFICTLLLNQ